MVRALTPPLAAAYGTRFRPPVATEDTLTMVPEPASSMGLSTAWHAYMVGNSERRISLSIFSTSYSSYGRAQMVPPTLLMSTSIRPWASSAAETDCSAPEACSRSTPVTAVARPAPEPASARSSMPAATSSAISERSTSTTVPPSAATRSATARPMP